MPGRPHFSALRPLALGAVLVMALAGTASPSATPSHPRSRPGHRAAPTPWSVERPRRGRGPRGLRGSLRQPAPRVPDVRDHARRRPRRTERRVPPVAAVRVRGSGPGASPEAAVAAAARTSLLGALDDITGPFVPCHDAAVALVEGFYTEALEGVPDGAAKLAGVAVGKRSAYTILAKRAGDGSDTPLVVTDFPQGEEARRVPVRHRRPPVRLRAPVGRGRRPSSAAPTGSGSSPRTRWARAPTPATSTR